jgi:hypothetical protein
MQGPTPETTEQPGESAKRTLVIELPEGGAFARDPAPAGAEMIIELPEVGAEAPDPALASAEAPRPLSRPPKRLTAGRWAAGAAALAVLAVLGYQVYKMFSSFDLPFEKVPLSTAVSGGATERRGPGATDIPDTIGRDTAAGDVSVKKADTGAARVAAPASKTKAASEDAGPRPAEPRPASRQPAPPRAAGGQGLRRAEPCTEATAALGLCSLEPGLAAKTETPAAAGRAIARPLESVVPKAVERAQPPALPCTEAVAALGLCTAESIQRKE